MGPMWIPKSLSPHSNSEGFIREPVSFENEIEIAKRLARKAGEIQLLRRGSNKIDLKEDGSPVTEVDRQCESLIRSEIKTAFPDDGFLGEESGGTAGLSGRTWIVDPLDGTRPYIRGIVTHAALIALEDAGGPAVGVIHLPALDLTCWATRGGGAFCNGEKAQVSTTCNLARSIGSGLGFVQRFKEPEGDQLFELMRRIGYSYGFMDAYSYVCVATGRLDFCVNLLDAPWDCAAAAAIISEAGGSWSDTAGIKSVHNGTFVASNGVLHSTVLEALR